MTTDQHQFQTVSGEMTFDGVNQSLCDKARTLTGEQTWKELQYHLDICGVNTEHVNLNVANCNHLNYSHMS